MSFFQINGTTVKTPQGCTWSLQDLSSDDSGRTLDGLMHKDIVAQKRKLVCKYIPMLSMVQPPEVHWLCFIQWRVKTKK